MSGAVLDTSVLIGEEAAISVVSLTELHFGVLLATGDDERARRTDRLAAVEATFDPLPATASVEQVPMLTHNTADFQIIADLVDVRLPAQAGG